MDMVKRVSRMREMSRDARQRGETVALVPTMGYLHEGHLTLVRRAREMADRVVLSLFVNPAQFGPAEDLAAYPRDLKRDAELCGREGVAVLFAPEAAEMYAADHRTWVEVAGLGERLCGRSRPGHFRGVATVVTKLFHIVAPRFAFFGQKDAQQLLIIRRMVRELNLDVEVVGVPTVREPDGLAMSSRNTYLTPDERRAAPVLFRALSRAREAAEAGESKGEELRRAMLEELGREPLARVDYAEVVDGETLEPVERIDGAVLCALAVRFGGTRLIDNILIDRGTKGE